MNEQPQPITPKTNVDLTGMKVCVKSGEYIGRVGKVSTEISGRWVVELQGAGKKSKPTTEVFNAEQLHVVTAKKAQEYPTDTTALASDNAALKKLLESRDQSVKEATLRAEKLASELAAALKKIDGLQEDVTQRDQLLIMANKVVTQRSATLPKHVDWQWLRQQDTSIETADIELKRWTDDGWQIYEGSHHLHYLVTPDGKSELPIFSRQFLLWRKSGESKPMATLNEGVELSRWIPIGSYPTQPGTGSRLDAIREAQNDQVKQVFNQRIAQHTVSDRWQQFKSITGANHDD